MLLRNHEGIVKIGGKMLQLFDLHCDSILNYKELNSDFLCKDTQFSLNQLNKMNKYCQTMAVCIPDQDRGNSAKKFFENHVAYLQRILKKQKYLVEQVLAFDDISRIINLKKCAIILTVESGAVLGGDLDYIQELSKQGVKIMGLVWKQDNELASGWETKEGAWRYDPKGLTEFGKQVVKKMEEVNMIVDVAHLTDMGFDDLCQIAKKPFIASHSNARSICNHRRNLSDWQIREIIQRKGLIGINLFQPFLSEKEIGDLDDLYRHIDHILSLGGEDVLSCGSDFDGADIHYDLDTPLKFANSAEYLLQRGVKESIINKIYYDNAVLFFKDNIK